MYVVIGKARLAGSADELVQRMRDHIAPLLQGSPGFKGICVFLAEQGDAVHAVGIFDDSGSAAAALQRVRQGAGGNMRDLVSGPPEFVRGEAVFHQVSHAQEQQKERHPPLFAMIRTYHGLPGQTETMHSVVSEHTLPAITRADGFRGFYAFRDEDNTDRAISVTLFNTREAAMRSHEDVLAIMRERLGELAYEMPDMTAGETIALFAA